MEAFRESDAVVFLALNSAAESPEPKARLALMSRLVSTHQATDRLLKDSVRP